MDCDKCLKPGQIFTLNGMVFQVRKWKESTNCKDCDAKTAVRYRVGNIMKTTYNCISGVPNCNSGYFKRIK